MSKRKRIAFLVGQAAEYYQALFLTGFQEESLRNDYDVCVFAMYEKYQSTRAREAGETSIFNLIPFENFDGIVLMLDTVQTPGVANDIEQKIRERAKCPVLSVDRQSEDFVPIFPNHYDGIKTLVEHLIVDHDVKDIAFLTGKSWHPYSKERLQAYMDTMEEHNLTIGKNRIFYGDFWYTSGEGLGDKLAKSGDVPEAIVCANDCMAIGLCKSLSNHGYRIPEDVKVIGYDSNEEGQQAPVPITSVTISAEKFGRYAAESIHRLIGGHKIKKFSDPVDVYYGCTCGCNNQSAIPTLALRKTWDTEISSNSVYSTFNHMDEDMLTQTSFSGLMNTIYSYVYQIRDFNSFNICLNENWQTYGKVGEDRLGKNYSDRMCHILKCGEENKKEDRIGSDIYFDKIDLLPELNEDRAEPRCYFFTPIHFEDFCFGYAVISYLEPKSYDDGYRVWLRGVMRGLEYFRRQVALKESNAKLEASLVREAMTGLYNYKGFEMLCEQIIEEYSSKFTSIGVLAIDIKDLSKINDTEGRSVGDQAIINMGKFLTKVFDDGYCFCIGNGEFVVAHGLPTIYPTEIEKGLEKLNKLVDEYNSNNGGSTSLEFHYGIETALPAQKSEFESLIAMAINRKNAQKANMQKVADAQKLTEEEQQEAKIVHEILDKNKISYHFQPIVDARTGDIYAYEALMRAQVTPYLAPPVVLRYAEFFNRLYDVEKATFYNVLDIVHNNVDDFAEGAKIFINSIPNQVLKGADRTHMQEMVAQHNTRFVVELTEQAEIENEDLKELKHNYEMMGVETAVDDYGTGYSNVTNLLRYMPNYVKIDRMLLSEIQNSSQKQHFVKEIITFAHDNGILALAEGVETFEELQTVIRLEADLIQGYYVGRPTKDVVKEINSSIKQEILQVNREVFETRQKNIYVAGREGRIALPVLEKDHCKTIVVTNGQYAFRDFTIAGAPGLITDMGIEIQDGYQGRIVLDNCGFRGKKTGYAIDIGDSCDVTLVITGENTFEGVGIRVAENSRVTFEGDGFLDIKVHKIDSFAIGNDMESRHGTVIFDLGGIIDITVGGSRCIGIGSGLGGDVIIRKGEYYINLSGQEGVGIGSFDGDITPVIKRCSLNINSSAINTVAVGSFNGSVDVLIEDNAFKSNISSEKAVLAGSFNGKNTSVYINRAGVKFDIVSDTIVGIGAFESEKVDIGFDYISVTSKLRGKEALFVGDFNHKSKIKNLYSHIECEISTEREDDLGADENAITIVKGRSRVFLNGKEYHRVADLIDN